MVSVDHAHECFLISPIGEEGSATRERADGVRDFIVKPAIDELGMGLEVVRADDISRPGQITLDVIDHVLNARVAVADLTDLNPNVFYELAARHAARLPVVLITHEDQLKALPFDLQQMRTIPYSDTNLKKAAEAREAIKGHVEAGLGGAVDSPIAAAINLEALRTGNSGDQTLAQIVSLLGELSASQRKTLGELREFVALTGTARSQHLLDAEFRSARQQALRDRHMVAVTEGEPVDVWVSEAPHRGAHRRVRVRRAGHETAFTVDDVIDDHVIVGRAIEMIEQDEDAPGVRGE